MQISRSFVVVSLIGITCLAASAPCAALQGYNVEPQELVLMPDYCKAKMSGGQMVPMGDWPEKFGDVWGHMHHYCHGLKYLQRSSKPLVPKQEKLFNLQQALGEFDYMLGHSPPNFWFNRDVHMQKAIIYTRMGRSKEASLEYQQANMITATAP